VNLVWLLAAGDDDGVSLTDAESDDDDDDDDLDFSRMYRVGQQVSLLISAIPLSTASQFS